MWCTKNLPTRDQRSRFIFAAARIARKTPMSERILVVEDDPLIADTIRFNIRGEVPDADIIHVRTVQEARLAVERDEPYDFVYVDLWSDDVSGFQGLREFKKLFPGQSVLIAFRHLTMTA